MSRAIGSNAEMSIGAYLIQRLQDYGIGTVFGIPGDYVLSFYSMLEQSPLQVVGCTREDCAGFAADAYARVHGMGAVCVTYCVGGLSVCNSIAGAYAEKSPVVLITGSPGLSERVNNPLLHHKVRDFYTQLEVFEKLCVAGAELSDPFTAFAEIDRVLDTCQRFKRPVFLEIPRDMVHVVPTGAPPFRRSESVRDPQATAEAVDEAAQWLERAQRPVLIAGVEIHRFGLQDRVLELAEQTRLPIASTLLGKSVVSETHPQFIGIYEGALGRAEVTQYVEDSDLVMLLGTFMTDINLGLFTCHLDPAKCIYATSEQLRIRHHHYHQVDLGEFLSALIGRRPKPTARDIPGNLRPTVRPYALEAQRLITIERLIGRLNQQIDCDTIVIADIGDALFSATELTIRERTDFLSPAYYTSMGFAVPATVGALFARPSARVLAIVGDGAFQMTGMELSTIVRHGLSPVVIVLDNHGYGTERYLHAGDWKYNEIHGWRYSELPKVLGGGVGYEVRTEGEFDDALRQAWNDRSACSILHVRLTTDDASRTLRRLAERLGQRV